MDIYSKDVIVDIADRTLNQKLSYPLFQGTKGFKLLLKITVNGIPFTPTSKLNVTKGTVLVYDRLDGLATSYELDVSNMTTTSASSPLIVGIDSNTNPNIVAKPYRCAIVLEFDNSMITTPFEYYVYQNDTIITQ